MSESLVSAAVVAALEVAGARPYTIDDIKALKRLPSAYTEVHVYERFPGGPRRAGAASTVTQWHILCRCVGETFDNARVMRERARLALHEVTLTVAGELVPVEKSTSDDPIGEDDGWYSGLSEFSCVL